MEQQKSLAQYAGKGIMIIAVVFFHAFIMSFENHADSIAGFNPLVAVFPFLLSAFFFYAGYNYTPSEKTYGQLVARRAKQLLIPLVTAFVVSVTLISLMEICFYFSKPENQGWAGILQPIGNSVLYGLMSEPLAWMIHFPQQGGIIFELILSLGLLWFLLALFVCSVFFYLLVKHTNKSLLVLLSVVAGLLLLAFVLCEFVNVYLPYSVGCYPVVLAIMLVGAYLRQRNFLERPMDSKKAIALQIANALIAEGLIIGTCFFCYYRFGSTTVGALPGGKFDDYAKGLDVFITFAFGILGTYFLHTFCRLIVRIPVVGFCLSWVGQHSAFFYLFHPIFLDLAAILIFRKTHPWGQGQAYFYVAIVVAMLTGVCLLIDFLVKKRKEKKQGLQTDSQE